MSRELGVIGIDPGKSGGIAYRVGKDVEVGTLGSLAEFQRYIKECKRRTPVLLVFIEKVGTWRDDGDSPGKWLGISKMNAQYNQLIATFTLLDICYVEVPSITWQTYLKKLGVRKKEFKNPKNAYKAFAIERYPSKLKQITLKTADALCILFYGYQMVRRSPDHYKQLLKETPGYG